MSSMRNSHVRSVRVTVAVFLAKLRLALSNRVLAALFHLDNERVVSHIVRQVRTALMKDFVPFHLGLQHINRQTAIEQYQTTVATILHTNKPKQLCVVADETYLFIQKSSNNQLQRKCYSMHKHRNLVKPMILTATLRKNNQIGKKYDAQMCLFPGLSRDDVRNLCFGSYQVKQTMPYIQEHLTPSPLYEDELEFIVELSSKNDYLVRARFSSRHSNNKNYIAVIQYNIRNTEQPINGWYCTCTTGRRDVGYCAHVAALIVASRRLSCRNQVRHSSSFN
ncbi:unnamed protein product [Rotaria magnacalcarata]